MKANPLQDYNIRVFIIEDNPGDVYIIRNYLTESQTDFSFYNSTTLKEALKRNINGNFDVVLLDLGLPDSLGLNTLKKIILSGVKVPIIIMTNLNDEDIALQAMKEGAQDYLVKNDITSEALIRSIRYSIERKNIQIIKEKNTLQFTILSSATVAINECNDVLSIYNVFCDQIRKLIKDVQICYFDFLKNEEIKACKNCNDLNGFLNNPEYKFLFNGKLHNITQNVQHDIKSEILAHFESIDPGNNLYVIGFSREERHYGGVIIFAEEPVDNNDQDIIETISNQASLNIHRRVIENQLRESEGRYKILFNEISRAKEALQNLNSELDVKVKERTAEITEINSLLQLELAEHRITMEKLKESARNLKELNAMKDKFFGIIAHDLRNPFAGLLGLSELMLVSVDNMTTAEIKDIVQSFYDSAKSSFTLLENLLEWSRSQTGTIRFRPEIIHIRKLIEYNISGIKAYGENKKIELRSGIIEDLAVLADMNMINTILRNLLNNAVKFTHPHGKITVTAVKHQDSLVVSVKDNGVGISADNIARLFHIGSNYTNAGTDNEKGTGLGLLLCKEFIDKHSGKIWVESKEGKGSDFKFSIPLNVYSDNETTHNNGIKTSSVG